MLAPSFASHAGTDLPEILLVDDDALVRKGLRLALKSTGYENVCEAANDSEGSMALRMLKVSLMIVDVQMPGDNGIEILRKIRSGLTAARRDLPVIIHTSFAQREVLGAAMALDANGFLVKPMRASHIREKIEQALAERIELRSVLAYAAVATDLVSIPALDSWSVSNSEDEPLSAKAAAPPTRRVAIEAVEFGMCLAENICTDAGTLLLSRGCTLTQLHVNRLADLRAVLAKSYITVV